MDFLPLPPDTEASSFEVQIDDVRDIEYDDGDFSTYPERQGWTERTVGEWLDLFQRPSREFTKFIERWLLFGTLSHFFRGGFEYKDLIRSVGDPPRLVLTMLPFRRFLEVDVQYELAVPWAFSLALFLHTQLAMSENDGDYDEYNLHITQTLVQSIETRRFKDPRSPEMAWVTGAWLEVLLSWEAVPSRIPECLNLSADHKSVVWKLLREQDWCPSDLITAFHRFNSSSLYFLHIISQRRPAKSSHRMIRVRREGQLPGGDSGPLLSSRGLCSPFLCGLNQLNDRDYITKHANGCNGCQNIQAHSETLFWILKKRRVPLIHFDKAGSITLVEKEHGMAYIAISHVWSDGLGNPHANALPHCQLQRLAGLIQGLRNRGYNSSLFWIDTICVPPDSAGLKEAQDSAMGLMRETYEHATAVLVLDSSLYGSTSIGKWPAENLMRIFCSRWTSRMWTYQEGVLAKSLYFQFSDTSIELGEEVQRLKDGANRIHQATIVAPLLKMYDAIRFLGNKESTFEENFVAACSSLGDRTTSVPSDEPLCLGTLLGLDVLHIAQTPPHLRMQEFWRMLPCVPTSILDSHLDRLDVPGLSWAPKTFLRSIQAQTRHGLPSHWEGGMGIGKAESITDNGLMIQRPGLLAKAGSIFMGPISFFKFENDDIWYTARAHTNGVRHAVPFKPFRSGQEWHSKFWIGPERGFESIGVILQRPCDMEFNEDPSLLLSEDRSTSIQHNQQAHLVAFKEEKDGIIHCEYLCHVTWERTLEKHNLDMLNHATPPGTGFYNEPCVREAEFGTLVSAVAQKKPAGQYWCIA
ncbi:hypothetical protein BJX61DRAFT_541453 [Aspergillus egyptiacus]|nr:hypothetical protein BJX61DRAFT_541453 [Aspergillus egyptiacus]